MASVMAACADGSSPRGRGTRLNGRRLDGSRRFIPARAGNTSARSSSTSTRAVHPRAGGEHEDITDYSVVQVGSSPRGRGTPRSAGTSAHTPRFIPARAGNTIGVAWFGSAMTVHPRAGGEHRPSAVRTNTACGSSPRGRGTRLDLRPLRHEFRFIPARAGNTDGRSHPRRSTAVHPRAGGEHIASSAAMTPAAGSSPRGRGTPGVSTRRMSSNAVHPRAGGEHGTAAFAHDGLAGSSPRGRGTLWWASPTGRATRFIPARAGNTPDPGNGPHPSAVHPRAGGEHRFKPSSREV